MWLAAAKYHRCSRRFSGSIAAAMCLRFLGRFKRFAAVGGSDGMLRGLVEWLEENTKGRFCVLNRKNYTSVRGGFVFLEGGFAKRGVRTNPPTPPPWLRACGSTTRVGTHPYLPVRSTGQILVLRILQILTSIIM